MTQTANEDMLRNLLERAYRAARSVAGASTEDAEDAAAEAVEGFLASKATVKVPAMFVAVAAKNAAIDKVRTRRCICTVPLYAKSAPVEDATLDTAVCNEAIDELAIEHADVIRCAYLGLTGPQAAAILGITVSAYKSRLGRARKAAQRLFARVLEVR